MSELKREEFGARRGRNRKWEGEKQGEGRGNRGRKGRETEGSEGENQGKRSRKKENTGIRENWMDKDGEIILWNI